MVEWLIDNAHAYDSVIGAIQSAQHSVWVTQLALDADCVAYGDGSGAPDRLLLAALTDAAGGRHGRAKVDVRILLNATLLLDTSKPLLRALRSRPDGPAGIEVRGVRHFPQLLHAKIVIIDASRAFLLGSPFVNGYWDDAQHRPVDDRRPARELGGRPLHDVSVSVTGPPVADLVQLFEALWTLDAEATERPLPTISAAVPTRTGDHTVEIVTTLPAGVLPNQPRGSRETLDALLDGIAAARRLIYIEHQYLSARPVIDAVAHALEQHSALEIIMVLNENPDITAYRRWQMLRLRESGVWGHPRVGLFALWSTLPNGTALDINQVFVHSKVVVVDDRWAMVGSANLDGVSLHSYGDDFAGWLGRRMFRDVVNFDVGIVVRDDTAPDSLPGTVADLRERLWAEQLGVPRGQLPRWDTDALTQWRAAAQRNIDALNTVGDDSRPKRMTGYLLPFSLQATPVRQLAEIGVRNSARRLNLCFNPGWMEVNFSPNWIRNMFL